MNNKVNVILKPYEYAMALDVARRRMCSSIMNSSKNNHGFVGHGWEENMEGACAELAAAKVLNVYWDGSNETYKEPDIGDFVQVRWAKPHGYSLIVRNADPSEHAYVLVTGSCPDYVVHGYLYGEDAKQDKWIKSPNGRPAAFFVPNENLLPILDLVDKFESQFKYSVNKSR